MTHGDIVRQMSNEELAEMLSKQNVWIFEDICNRLGIRWGISELQTSIQNTILEYLNREVEETE